MATIHIGNLARSRVILQVLRREHGGATDYWDGNWLLVDVDIDVGGFRGRFQASLRVDEFERFLAEVRDLQGDLEGTARFEAMEDWLEIVLRGDGLGHIGVEGMARDEPGRGNTLTFRLATDQTFLPPLIAELADVLAEFPILGQRPEN